MPDPEVRPEHTDAAAPSPAPGPSVSISSAPSYVDGATHDSDSNTTETGLEITPRLADAVDLSAAQGPARSNRRRRGTRGGRARRKPQSSAMTGGSRDADPDGALDHDVIDPDGALDHDDIDQPDVAVSERRDDADDRGDARPADLPDRPIEGVPPSQRPSARHDAITPVDGSPADGQPLPAPAMPRPRIGDTRPAPPIGSAAHPPGEGAIVRPGAELSADGDDRAQGRDRSRGRPPRARNRGARRQPSDESSGAPTNDGEAPGSAALGSEVPGTDRPERGTRSGRGDRSDRSDRADRVDRANRTDRADRAASNAEATGGSRRRRGKGEPVVTSFAEPDLDALERRKGKERKGRPVGRYLMCVHVQPTITQIAVLEGRALTEHYVSRPADLTTQIHGNVYLGRVQNVLPGMEAAFVDIGTPKNAVLYKGDLQHDFGEIEGETRSARQDVRIENVLRNGQVIVCQVTKNPIGTKGARLTQEVSLPGRFVVLIPNSPTYGISKRLSFEERRRLRRVLDEVRPEGHGLIVRTAAEGISAEELQRDVQVLLRQWEQIEAKAKKARAPSLLYSEPDMALRVIREEFNREYRGVVIDDEALFNEVRDYVMSISPELADRVELFDVKSEPLPMFERFHIHEQLHKAIDRKVWLPSGGSIIIERTEALTVIDVNTGKNVGSSNLEETVFRNNLEAAEEIAHQLRLRDIGGIIVVDFIDMEIRANRDEVVRHFRDFLARDKTRSQVFDISELGLVEMTRKRIGEGLVESLSDVCPQCGGRGIVADSSLF